jgi:hypothetical protein
VAVVAPPAAWALDVVNAAGTDVRPTTPSPAGTGWGAAACCARATRTAKKTTATMRTTKKANTARTDTATRAPRNTTGTVRTRGCGRCLPAPDGSFASERGAPDEGSMSGHGPTSSGAPSAPVCRFLSSRLLRRDPPRRPDAAAGPVRWSSCSTADGPTSQTGNSSSQLKSPAGGSSSGTQPRRRGGSGRARADASSVRRRSGSTSGGGWRRIRATVGRATVAERHRAAQLWTAGRTAQSMWISSAAQKPRPPRSPALRVLRPPRRAPRRRHDRPEGLALSTSPPATPLAPPNPGAGSRCRPALRPPPPRTPPPR